MAIIPLVQENRVLASGNSGQLAGEVVALKMAVAESPPMLEGTIGLPQIQPAAVESGFVQASQATAGTVVGGGLRGPRGEPGPLGDASVDLPGGIILGGHRLVHFDGTALFYADHRDPSKVDVLGMTLHAGLAGELITIKRLGLITELTWNWTPGPVFLGIDGLISQVAPETGAVVQVGHAVNATTLDLRINSPIFLE